MEIALSSGVGDTTSIGNGGYAANYDNDGFQDLFVANWGAASFFGVWGTVRFKTFHASRAWLTPTQPTGPWAAHGAIMTVMDM